MTEACGYEAKKLRQQGRGINRYDHRENPLSYVTISADDNERRKKWLKEEKATRKQKTRSLWK